MWRRNESAHVFDIQRRLGGHSIGGEEVIDGCAQELAIDEELEGDRTIGLEQAVDKSRELISAQFCNLVRDGKE